MSHSSGRAVGFNRTASRANDMNSPPDPQDCTKVALADARDFERICGPAQAVSQLQTLGELYRRKNEAPEHVLLTGSDGMGKRSIARAFAKSYSSALREVEAKELQRKGDLTAILTSVDNGEALLILNLQDMREAITDTLSLALEEFTLRLVIEFKSQIRIHPFPLSRFTCIATASREPDVNAKLLSCFSLRVPIRSYSTEESESLVTLLAGENGLTLAPEAVRQVLSVCGGNPSRIAQLLRRFLRFGKKEVSAAEAAELLAAFGLKSDAGGGTPTEIEGLSGIEFEKAITLLLARMGFRAEMTKASGDGGIDIVAHREEPIVGGRYLIQCKRFDASSQVGAPLVREFYGALVADRKALKGIFVTTSSFTAQAREFASQLPIELIDGDQLRILLERYKTESV
jgi:Holliday junction resolvasome RuvABC ATP-dependent DNA helicase subunit